MCAYICTYIYIYIYTNIHTNEHDVTVFLDYVCIYIHTYINLFTYDYGVNPKLCLYIKDIVLLTLLCSIALLYGLCYCTATQQLGKL